MQRPQSSSSTFSSIRSSFPSPFPHSASSSNLDYAASSTTGQDVQPTTSSPQNAGSSTAADSSNLTAAISSSTLLVPSGTSSTGIVLPANTSMTDSGASEAVDVGVESVDRLESPQATGTVDEDDSAPENGQAGENSRNRGLIAGIVAAAVIVLLVALRAFYCCRRRRQRAGRATVDMSEEPHAFGDYSIRGYGSTAGQSLSLYSHYPLSAVEPQSAFLPPTPAQEYASLARASTSPISPFSNADGNASSKCEIYHECRELILKHRHSTFRGDRPKRTTAHLHFDLSVRPRNRSEADRPRALHRYLF